MMKTATETTPRLLDLLDAHRGWDLIDGGEVWTVEQWIAEWTAGADAGDRGPAVVVWEQGDGNLAVMALDENGCPAELVGVLARPGAAVGLTGA
jgi:hypothetical protein